MKSFPLLLVFVVLTNFLFAGSTKQPDYYDPGEFVPKWAKSAIWYQIFPERFRNGDPFNDPSVDDIKDADPVDPPKAWQIHPWGSDWYKLQPWELENAEPELWKHLLRRRYGGDLKGVIDKLDYLQDLGINAIYFNPLFEAPSLHKYDGETYHHIDPNFGPDPDGDRELIKTENPLDPGTWVWTKADLLALELIKQAHKRGIRIIFDGVFNHMGRNSFAMADLVVNQKNSLYKDWFTVLSWDDDNLGTKFDYEGWFGAKSLPEFRETNGMIADGPKDYIFNATKRWMNPKGEGIEHGIDGWRLDVAFCVGHPFWKLWRKHVRSINPEAYLTAEIVDFPEKVIPYMQGDEFDGEMNYSFAFNCSGFFFNPEETRLSVSEFDNNLRDLREMYPQGVAYVNQNLFGSHDSNRVGSHIVNRGIGDFVQWGDYFGLSKAAENPNYKVRKPNAYELQLQKLFVIMQMTYVGAPMIYYGDEVGMWGANDPDCRKPMIWDDIQYEDEVYLPNGEKRDADVVEANVDLINHYKTLIAIRKENVELQFGDFRTVVVDDDQSIYAFRREYQSQSILVVFNNSESSEEIEIPVRENEKEFRDLLNLKGYKSESGKLKISVKARWAAVLKIK